MSQNRDSHAYPLTRSQQLIWTGQHLQPDEPLYNMALAFRLRGDFDFDTFSSAFAHLLRQSDALRITFDERDGVAHQYVNSNFDYTVELVDLSDDPSPEDALAAWQSQRAQQPFALDQCLFDSCIVRMATDDHVWFLNQHHLTTDAWSTSVLYQHMATLYELAERDALADAPALPAFTDFIEKEQRSRESKSMQRAQGYWAPRLETPFTPSSFYRPTPPTRGGRTRRVACPIGAARTRRIKDAAVSPTFRAITADLGQFQIFATAYCAWLHRLGGQREIAVGTPSHSRGSGKLKRTPGMFIEVYPLQVAIDKDETFASLYAQVAQATRELLVNAPPGASTFAHQRAYDVVLNYITAHYGPFAGRDMTSTWVHADHGDRGHLVRIQVEDFDRADAFGVFFDVNDDVFDDEDVARAQRDFLTMLDALLEQPESAVREVGLVTQSNAQRKLALGASGADGAPPQHTVVQAFDEQTVRDPRAVAIRMGSRDLSYADVQNASRNLAAQLRERGVARGDRVALALPRGPQAIVGMLATHRCGAAYVPIDIAYPADRIAAMLDNAGPRLILIDGATSVALPDTAKTLTLAELNLSGDVVVEDDVTIDDVAYVIYTSGSTGQPKGVEVTHANLINYAHWASGEYVDHNSASWPLFSSLAFDLTVTSIFVPLISGGRIVVYPESDQTGDLTIRDVIEDNQVDVIKLTPAHLSLILPMDLTQSSLKALILGGEDLKVDVAQTADRFFGGRVALYNEYGPTEGTVACMIYRYDRDAETGLSVPIGRPIDHAHIYIVDSNTKLQSLGAIGELAIGGAGVARGYRGQPQRTAERFVDNPFRPGEQMYLTGDLARWRDDGNLAYHGRRDDQIKVNGVRVELGDIEAALASVHGVRDAAARLSAQESVEEEAFCQRCGLSGRHPTARLDVHSVCHVCRIYEDERERALKYFGTLDDLRLIVAGIKAKKPSTPDCMMLLSGGKDSTYALCQLVDLGLTPLVLTLDNGFISDGAKANMRRVVDKLGLELVNGSSPTMNEIFVDSLERFSNVCNGCFKTIYTLAVQLAKERGITHIFTGLSRGQIFETRVADQFGQRIFDPVTIDQNIIEARKAYHRADDAVSRTMDVSVFDDDDVFQSIRYVDFYRYTDVSLDEMLNYLGSRVPWVRPADTGRSTNCLINEAGIFVHKAERGFHNYSLPYSWDVRLGHKQRDAARDELDDRIDIDNVRAILDEIGYDMPDVGGALAKQRKLCAYYVADDDIDSATLRDTLATKLPRAVIPSQFVRVESLPLTRNGKVDRAALPDPDSLRPELGVDYVAPDGVVERKLAAIWQHVLGVDRIGADDNFFDLGGDSILNIQIVARARKQGLTLLPQQIFEHATVRQLAGVVGDAVNVRSEQGPVVGPTPLNPIQQRFFEREAGNLAHCNQWVWLTATGPIKALVLEEALRQVLNQHDALRARFEHGDGGWQQVLQATDDVSVSLELCDLSALPARDQEEAAQQHCEQWQQSLSLEKGELVRVALIERGSNLPPWLIVIVHHLAMDGVSWWVVLEDLQSAYGQLQDAHPVALPPKTTSVRRFAKALTDYANRDNTDWRHFVANADPSPSPMPIDGASDAANVVAGARDVSVTLNREQTTGLLVDTATAWRTQAPDVLLTALAETLCEWHNSERVQIDLEGHGREVIADDVDLLRTAGWLTSICPVTLVRPDAADAASRVRDTKTMLRALPDRGLAYGASRYLSGESTVRDALAQLPPAKVLFNYLGQWDRARAGGHWFHFARPVQLSEAPDMPREHAIAINVIAYDGQLTITWTYSESLHRRETIETLANTFRAHLIALIDACRDGGGSALAPTDFPTAGLDQSGLDDLLADFGDL
ncbi:MAG: amino acid adenylation domain-containing protein [Gammaproteobacteria bacterium]